MSGYVYSDVRVDLRRGLLLLYRVDKKPAQLRKFRIHQFHIFIRSNNFSSESLSEIECIIKSNPHISYIMVMEFKYLNPFPLEQSNYYHQLNEHITSRDYQRYCAVRRVNSDEKSDTNHRTTTTVV